MAEPETSQHGNGRRMFPTVRIIEGLIIAAVVGAISMFGVTQVIQTKLDALCSSFSKVEHTLSLTNSKLESLAIDNERQWGIIKRNTEIIDLYVLGRDKKMLLKELKEGYKEVK